MASREASDLFGLPEDLAVVATQYRPRFDDKRGRGQLIVVVRHRGGTQVGGRHFYSSKDLYDLEGGMDDAMGAFAEAWNLSKEMALRDKLKKWMGGPLLRGAHKRGKHSIIRRMFYWVPRGAVKRRRQEQAVDSTSMAGEVVKNHCFMSTGTTGVVRSRLLPCSCKVCWDADGFYSENCTESELNELPKGHTLGLTIDTSKSDASIAAREKRIAAELEQLDGSTSVVPLYHGQEGEAEKSMGRLFWLADIVDAPFDHANKKVLRAFVYDEQVVEDGAVTRVTYTAPAAQKCKHQHKTTGKCSKRNCELWHWMHMDAGSVREPMLKTDRDSRKHFKKVPGKKLAFTLSAGIVNGISDQIAQDDKLYYETVGTID